MAPTKDTEMKLPRGWKRVRGASNYALSKEGHIHNLKTGKPVSRRWRGLRYWSSVTCDDGYRRQIAHDALKVPPQGLPDEEMELVEGYPDYKVTPYGAVWKHQNTPRKFYNRPFLVSTKDIGEKEYVRLSTEDGRRHWVRMEKIMGEAYPND
tara:strand:- start:503 stop:958 length:456 start_codon:yes stop_codon:yes gene_type:complete